MKNSKIWQKKCPKSDFEKKVPNCQKSENFGVSAKMVEKKSAVFFRFFRAPKNATFWGECKITFFKILKIAKNARLKTDQIENSPLNFEVPKKAPPKTPPILENFGRVHRNPDFRGPRFHPQNQLKFGRRTLFCVFRVAQRPTCSSIFEIWPLPSDLSVDRARFLGPKIAKKSIEAPTPYRFCCFWPLFIWSFFRARFSYDFYKAVSAQNEP